MVRSLIDTDILSEYLKGYDQTVVGHAARYAERHGVFTITSVTVHEIVYGLKFRNALSQLDKAVAWFGQIEVITPTHADYVMAATIRATARQQGEVVELPDSLIASVAVRLDRSVITGNTGDFEAIRRTGIPLLIQNWRLP